ncbi:MAG TPA: alpha/beta fold hydrolase [Opitutaceae bacterium]|nr:alpha/beta fold hydrolase [Opitutaceae bacterium]
MIFVMPGMGADHRMYAAPAWHTLPDARFLDWPAYRGENSIGAIATRVIAEAEIHDGDTVIGSSLGGIVACEIANRLQLRSLVLIGSAQSPSEIAPLLAVLHPLAAIAPLEIVRFSAGKLPGELSAMFAESQTSFIRAMCHAIFVWSGLESSRIRPLRIHGRSDHVIPPPANANLLLYAGHLLAMTRADECVAFLQSRRPWDAPRA